jgi:hypothetical protein
VLAAVSLLGVALLVAGWWIGVVGERVRDGGPLADDGWYIWFYEARTGTVFSEGMQTIINDGSEPSTVRSVRVTGGEKALEYLGARIGLPGRPNDFHQRMRGFPPKAVPARFQIPADGAVLEPHKSYMLILGYRVIDEVLARRTSVTVDYEVGGDRYRATYPISVVACPPPLTDNTCADKFEPVEELFE